MRRRRGRDETSQTPRHRPGPDDNNLRPPLPKSISSTSTAAAGEGRGPTGVRPNITEATFPSEPPEAKSEPSALKSSLHGHAAVDRCAGTRRCARSAVGRSRCSLPPASASHGRPRGSGARRGRPRLPRSRPPDSRLADVASAAFVSASALAECHGRRDRRHEHERSQSHAECAEAAVSPPRGLELAFVRGAALLHELPLERVQLGTVGLSAHRRYGLETRPPQERSRVPSQRLPFQRRFGQPPMSKQALPVRVEPGAKCRPLANERLVAASTESSPRCTSLASVEPRGATSTTSASCSRRGKRARGRLARRRVSSVPSPSSVRRRKMLRASACSAGRERSTVDRSAVLAIAPAHPAGLRVARSRSACVPLRRFQVSSRRGKKGQPAGLPATSRRSSRPVPAPKSQARPRRGPLDRAPQLLLVHRPTSAWHPRTRKRDAGRRRSGRRNPP